MPRRSEPLARAYAVCEALARSHYENFPVASWLLPRVMRPHIAAVYAFARIADDIADEGEAPAAERAAQLRAWQDRLHAAVASTTGAGRAAFTDDTDHRGLMLVALAHSIRTLDLPISLFDDLVSAFAQDTTTSRYDSWEEVFDYCRRSANPVGRLVLRIAGYHDETLARSSDALCTALQLTNFWQDFGRDWQIGRLYVPRDAVVLNRAREMDLSGAMLSGEWLAVLDGCIAVTREKFAAGRAVCDGVRGRLRYELRLTWHGGMRVLDAVEDAAPYLLHDRPTLGLRDAPSLLWRAARWTAPSKMS
ncbi:MAG: squalene synthase HpnC [Acidobacteria bacterium]|nr:squalene synthase HpnC [Acidobacteriota bacterium]